MTLSEMEGLLGKTEREIVDGWRSGARRFEAPYRRGELSFVPNLLPAEAIRLPLKRLLGILTDRYGKLVEEALSPESSDPARPARELPSELRGPRSGETSPSWIRRSNMVGVNIRTVGSFMEVAKYALTLPAVQDSIHLLPIWEPGVVESLYGMSSWKINGEFLSRELPELYPHLRTPERQLKALVNLLHLMGKSVGMDVIPHTDRFSEVVLANPGHFEWLRREDTRIVDHREELHLEVQERILAFLNRQGAAADGPAYPGDPDSFFSPAYPEEQRNRILFGPAGEPERRAARRSALARDLYLLGYEPVPATMAPPYRGLLVDRERGSSDADGHIWRDYLIANPEAMSRVFGPLTRYKLYRRVDDNRNWVIDFENPRPEVWEYVARRYAEMQERHGFDFMRGDMSHVQMRPEGVPLEAGEHYDILGYVKECIRNENGAPQFGYFAESFLSPPDVMAYGNEIDHLEAARAEVTLGDLQSQPFGSDEFLRRLRRYWDIGESRGVTPSLTVLTGDKDDPRFDEFYRFGNEARLFLALFAADRPSYMALNFECRDLHYEAGANEEYTKLYVFKESEGPKATRGPFRFGRNGYQFYGIGRIRLLAEELPEELSSSETRWVLPPDPTGGERLFAWTIGDTLLAVVNGDREKAARRVKLPLRGRPTLRFSTCPDRVVAMELPTETLGGSGAAMIDRVEPGEAQLYTLR